VMAARILATHDEALRGRLEAFVAKQRDDVIASAELP